MADNSIPPRPVVAVDDSEDDNFVFCRLMNKAEIDLPLHVVEEGEAAVVLLDRLVKEGRPPLVCFLDVKMPGMQGHDILAWIRSKPELNDVPVVMLSSSDDPADIQKAVKLGAQCYLRKHPDVAELQAMIAQAVGFVSGKRSEVFEGASNLFRRLNDPRSEAR